jgi:hypothetical protein
MLNRFLKPQQSVVVVALVDTIVQISCIWTAVPFELGAVNKKPLRYI